MNIIGNTTDWEDCIQRLLTLQMEMRVPGYISSKHSRMLTAIIRESSEDLNKKRLLETVNREQDELMAAEAFRKLRKGGLINKNE